MIKSLITPSSIAVVGVSTDPTKVGHQIFVNLSSFKGDVIPVNPTHKQILGKTAYPDVLSIPQQVDYVVIATPGNTVEAIIDQCIDKKVKAVSVIAAGFAETSAAGLKTQQRIAEKLEHNHIALLGPNTLGSANPHLKLNATFAKSSIAAGSIALISQSGALLTTLFEELDSRGVGCSFALSLGNTAGVNANDALEYALTDRNTKVIALYLESLPDTSAFFSLCKKVSRTKPIIFLKGGMTNEGQKASLSHTAALATNGVLLKEASYQMGYTMVSTLEQFFETMFFLDSLLAQGPKLPTNTMILTNAGGPGVNTVDIASTLGVPLAEWTRDSIGRFARHIPRVHPANPTDLLGDASTEDIEHAISFADDDPQIDSVLLIITPQAVTDIPAITALLIKRMRKDIAFSGEQKKPLIVALMGGEDQHSYIVKLRDAGVTAVEYSNEAIEIYSFVHHVRKAQEVDRSARIMRELEHKMAPITPTRQSFPLTQHTLEEALLLMEAYGFSLPRCAIISTRKQLDELDELDPKRVYPLFAKTTNLELKHKAVLGAVVGDIQSKEGAVKAFEHLQKFGKTVILQEVIEDATELIVGTRRDPQFGTFIAVGSGGSMSNILNDRSYVFLPASQREIQNAFRRTKICGTLSSEQRSLVLLCLERMARLMKDHPEIQELEINPLMVTKHQAYVADIKVEVTS